MIYMIFFIIAAIVLLIFCHALTVAAKEAEEITERFDEKQ